MNNIKAIKSAIHNLKHNYQIGSRDIAEQNLKEQLKIIEFNLKDLELLDTIKKWLLYFYDDVRKVDLNVLTKNKQKLIKEWLEDR